MTIPPPEPPPEPNPYAPPVAPAGRARRVEPVGTSALELILALIAAAVVGLIAFLAAGFAVVLLLDALERGQLLPKSLPTRATRLLGAALALLAGGAGALLVVGRLYRWVLAPVAATQPDRARPPAPP